MTQVWNGERLETFVFNEATIEHLHRYAIATTLVKEKTVLDIACGEGYGANFLAQKAARVVGIDIDALTIQNAQSKYGRDNLNFKTGSVTQIPEHEASFDVVISFETLEHINEHEKMVHEVKRVLKENGIFIISTPDKKWYTDASGYRNPHHLKELYEADFKNLVQQHFKNTMFLQQSFIQGSLIILEGTTQGFTLHSGDYNTLLESRPQPAYWIAIASNVELPQLPGSFFYNEQITKIILESEKAAVKKTATYRVGHFLLYPFKRIRALLK